MSTTASGQFAEQKASEYLEENGFKVLERNWKRPHCEIDIVAQRSKTVYFVEVKYRASNHFGGGLEYIARNKLHHMGRAAETWVLEHVWKGPYQLSAIEVSGQNFQVTDFIESVF